MTKELGPIPESKGAAPAAQPAVSRPLDVIYHKAFADVEETMIVPRPGGVPIKDTKAPYEKLEDQSSIHDVSATRLTVADSIAGAVIGRLRRHFK